MAIIVVGKTQNFKKKLTSLSNNAKFISLK